MQLDPTDLKILQQLQEDGRISNQDLADKVFCRRLRACDASGCSKKRGLFIIIAR